ncbi:hypothetical protein PV726_32425 [Streptomyces europaeiscabiei]|uniref:hypothetical protein n=1 Tax=Streptomyces europaeiscabiei TaxID=146819 RepID=UPI0029AC9CB9|nr:hypothetical protein [Streptomyces europaeiscabiei]MDX3694964.1 hypothetical protein [Streptomyces europaeiscabiei]
MEHHPTASITLNPRRIAALQLIADHGATLIVIRIDVGGRRVVTHDGTRIRTDVYDTLAAAGLLLRDTSTSLEEGQAVSLTETGRTALLDAQQDAPHASTATDGAPAERLPESHRRRAGAATKGNGRPPSCAGPPRQTRRSAP